MIEFDIHKNEHISALLFGGKIKEERTIEVMDIDGSPYQYKSGKKEGTIKTRKMVITRPVTGFGLNPQEGWGLKKEGTYQTDEEVLNSVSSHPSHPAAEVCKLILEIKKINKLIGTYYDGFKKNKRTGTLQYIDERDSCVHPTFSHCGYEENKKIKGGTRTSRLSCSKPNMQNQPDGMVLEHFGSRFGEDGVIVSADYSQIEVRIEAWLSGDTNFIKDVLNGVDFHIKKLVYVSGKSYEELFNLINNIKDPYWIKRRKEVKAVTFAKQYGAGIKK
jgi:DNA polymerase-1